MVTNQIYIVVNKTTVIPIVFLSVVEIEIDVLYTIIVELM